MSDGYGHRGPECVRGTPAAHDAAGWASLTGNWSQVYPVITGAILWVCRIPVNGQAALLAETGET